MTDVQTPAYPREWMDFDWILAQQDCTGMSDDDLMIVHSVAMGIGHGMRQGCTILCKYVEAGPTSGHYPTIKPADMHMVLTEPDLLREARVYARLTLGELHVQVCLRFLEALSQAQTPTS